MSRRGELSGVGLRPAVSVLSAQMRRPCNPWMSKLKKRNFEGQVYCGSHSSCICEHEENRLSGPGADLENVECVLVVRAPSSMATSGGHKTKECTLCCFSIFQGMWLGSIDGGRGCP